MKRFMLYVLGLSIALCGSYVAYAGGKAHWGYTGNTGPAHWGKLSEKFIACSTGRNQSPINLTGMVQADLADIKFNYRRVTLKILNNGHTIEAKYAKGSRISVDRHTYELLQFHFHSPSENHINGRSFPLEAHLVHADKKGNLAVVAVMFVEGKSNPFIDTLWKHMPAKAGTENSVPNIRINVMDLLPANKAYYRYNGSLTTPPCSEGVRWMVMKNPVEISRAQGKKFHSTMRVDNNRPVQPLNARLILKYGGKAR